ncbi:hypothetical protein B0A55_12532 [Friedmanniomyces simplex]|uniref:Uncharacterized protein n=1 Tax=Friedmanniomyces simplex TaxID=329884 RepID=A0A4U0W8P6_9PEZI|nr:hypothetical protein B0A55_12532 [Friedmanniomyces simplex]
MCSLSITNNTHAVTHYPTLTQCPLSKPPRCFSLLLYPNKQSLYKRAANRAPRPRRPADAIWTLLADAADEELLELDEAEAVLEPPVAEAALAPEEPDEPTEPEEPDEPDAAEPVAATTLPLAMPADAPVVTATPAAPPRTTVVELPTLMEMYETVPLAFWARLVTPSGRPAGMVATAGWLVTTTGEAVSPAGTLAATGWLVTTTGETVSPAGTLAAAETLGWPVTTPRELVSVSSVVCGTL